MVWQIDLDTFGETKQIQAKTTTDPNTGTKKPFEFNLRFAGQYYDSETGYHYNYHRYYNPETGRYLTSDPIGLDGGLNTYGYVGNRPYEFVDPWGLSAQDVIRIQAKFNATIKDMTKNGQRMDWTLINNTCRAMPWLPNCPDNVKDCGEQTEYMNAILSLQHYDDNWQFLMDVGAGHAWGVAVSSNPNDPILWYDARANEFSIDKVCKTCKPWWGNPVYGEEYLRKYKVPPKPQKR